MTEQSEPAKESRPQEGEPSAADAQPGASVPPEFGSPFDYDATADASMTESTSGTSAVPPSGGNSAGPGWDTFSGVGNGPGWGSGPSYPPPSSDPLPPTSGPVSSGPVYGTPQPDYGSPAMPPPSYPSTPGPGYPAAPAYPTAPGYPGAYGDPSAPFGRDPVTGEPYSDKSRATAGLLQILLGFVFVPGVGRLYIGSVAIGLVQLLVFWLGLVTVLIGGVFVFPVIWIWAFVDGILMLSGAVRDSQGRPLKT